MLFSLEKAAAVAAFLTALPVQAVPFPLEERSNSCNADNLLRLLRTPSNLPEALPFCSSYLNLPASTVTVSTVTPTATSYTTNLSNQTILFTENPIFSLTITSTETSVIVTTTTLTLNAQAPARLARRAASTKTTTAFVDKVTGTTYPPSRISSACACLTIPIDVTEVTATAPEVTETITLSSTSVTSSTVTLTLTESTSVTETSTVYSTVTSTTTNAPLIPTAYALKVVAPGTQDDGLYVYNRNENANNNGIGASQSFPITTDLTKATKFTISPDGALRIAVSSTLFTSSVVGQESADWVHFNHPSIPFEALYANKRASIDGCTNCYVVKWNVNPVTGFCTPSNAGSKPITVCNFPAAGYGRGLYVGSSSATVYACVTIDLRVVPLY
ncbi:hypothetical protein TWF173_005176 [Orbilia oligospora]|nr:hypothetical protein TWF173_005176 [Orbilia oligospora]